MAMIEMRDVSKWYGPVQVLNGCTTPWTKGEVVVVCGPSGSAQEHLDQDGQRLEPSRRRRPRQRRSRWATRKPTHPAARADRHGLPSTSSSSRT